MRVNQIGITIYDNKPNLPANKWYETTDVKDDVKNRYKIEMNFLHKGSPIKLRSSLIWPPSQLRRLSAWKDNAEFYESCKQRADEINLQIRSGKISAQVPALLAMPNMNESFQTTDKRKHFKWVMPQQPSAIIATRRLISPEFYQWHIQWLSTNFEQEFTIDQNSRADEVPGRRGPSTRVYKGFPGPHSIADTLITPDYATPTYVINTHIDEAFDEFKRRVQYLFSMNLHDEARVVMNQFTAYTERWNKEFE